jgi:hypothetical protein
MKRFIGKLALMIVTCVLTHILAQAGSGINPTESPLDIHSTV